MEALGEGQQGLQNPSSTSYSFASADRLFVDNFNVNPKESSDDNRHHSPSQLEVSEPLTKRQLPANIRVISLAELVQSDEFLGDNSTFGGVQDESSSGIRSFILFIKQALRQSSAAKLKDHNHLNRAIMTAAAQHQVVVDLQAGGLMMPLNALDLCIFSTFKNGGTRFFGERPGARSTDYRIWTEGFSAKVFAHSARLLEGKSQPIWAKYRVSGSEQKYADFYEPSAVYNRNRSMFKQLLDVSPIDPNMSSAPPHPEFERIAEAFFGGLKMDENFEASIAKANESEIDVRLLPTKRQHHVINYQKSTWAEFVQEVVAAAATESIATGRQINPFRNTAHKNFGMFLQDVIVANEMEQAVIKKTHWHKIRVYRGDAQLKALQVLNDAKVLTSKDVTAISQLDTSNDMFMGKSVEDSFIDHIWFPADRSVVDKEENVTAAEATAQAAAAELIANNEAEGLKQQVLSKKKSKGRKSKPARPSIKDFFQEETRIASCDDREQNDTSSNYAHKEIAEQKNIEGAEVTGLGLEISNDKLALESSQRGDENEESQAKSGSNVTKPSWPIPVDSIITLADYEDSPVNSRPSIDEDKGWQTVKPKAQKFGNANSGKGTLGSFQGSQMGLQRLSNPQTGSRNAQGNATTGYGQQNIVRQQGTSNGQNQSVMQFSTNLVAKTATNAKPKKPTPDLGFIPSTPLNGSSRKSSAQVTSNPLKAYENEFPAMPTSGTARSISEEVVKDSGVGSQEIPQRSVSKNEKPVKKTSKKSEKSEAVNPKPGFEPIATASEEIVPAALAGEMAESEHITAPAVVPEPIEGEESANNNEELKESIIQEALAKDQVQISQDNGPEVNEGAVLNGPVPEKEACREDPKIPVDHCGEECHPNETKHRILTPVVSVSVTGESTEFVPLDSGEVSMSPVIKTELDGQVKQLDDSLSWALDTITEPTNFETRSRSSSVPQEFQSSQEVFEASPVLFPRRARSQSAEAWVSEESLSKPIPSIELEDNASAVAEQPADDQPGDDQSGDDKSVDDQPAAVHPAEGRQAGSQQVGDAAPPNNLIVVTIHPGNTFTISCPVPGTTSITHGSGLAVDQAYVTNPPTASSSTPGSGSAANQASYGGFVGGHQYTYHPYPGGLAPNAQVGVRTHGSGNNDPVNHTNFPPVSTGGNPYANPLNPAGSAGGMVQPYKIIKSADEGEGISQAVASASAIGPHEKYHCTQCTMIIVPTMETPMVFCPGCGPNTSYKYCSTACLLVDAYNHAAWCMNYPASARMFPHSFPPDSPYLYETNPVISEDQTSGSREKFRQRAFALYCRYGPFPKLAEAWCRSHPGWQWPKELQDWEGVKYTGVYHIFSSGAFEPTDRGNPCADVIYTINFVQGDQRKAVLSRAIHALFVRDEGRMKPIAAFVYRMIRDILLTPGLHIPTQDPIELVLQEFERQFKLEFGFDHSMDTMAQYRFNFAFESCMAMPYMLTTEANFPILRYWARD